MVLSFSLRNGGASVHTGLVALEVVECYPANSLRLQLTRSYSLTGCCVCLWLSVWAGFCHFCDLKGLLGIRLEDCWEIWAIVRTFAGEHLAPGRRSRVISSDVWSHGNPRRCAISTHHKKQSQFLKSIKYCCSVLLCSHYWFKRTSLAKL